MREASVWKPLFVIGPKVTAHVFQLSFFEAEFFCRKESIQKENIKKESMRKGNSFGTVLK